MIMIMIIIIIRSVDVSRLVFRFWGGWGLVSWRTRGQGEVSQQGGVNGVVLATGGRLP